ncbi:hypothetical protein BC834DRAFT_610477 [Gloeopeniophorella convolvens]|nr:hypothetical protein BC834DRAFT_610477 [Gloeopeniophorella convolvens]
MSAVGVDAPPFHGTVMASAFKHTVTIESLPDVVLLEVFDHCREEELRKGGALQKSQPHLYQWYQLVPAHVCQRWRQIIIASPTRLRLSILCSWELPVAEILRHSPAELPVSILYPTNEEVFHEWSPESISDALLALGYLDRTSHIVIDALTSEEDKLLSMINRPAPKLETLHIECIRDRLTIPHTFTLQGNARLRRFELFDISNPFQLTPPASVTDFILSLDYPEGSTHVDWLETLGSQLRNMPQLECLDLELDSLPLTVSIDRGGAPISLPRLSEFTFSGSCYHLEGLISLFDAPVLSQLNIDFVDLTTPIDIPELSRYIQASPRFNASVAHVGIARGFAYIRTDSDGGSIRLRVINYRGTVADEDTRIMKPTIIAINSALEPVFSSARTLVLGFNNDADAEEIVIWHFDTVSGCYWNEALKGFKSVTTLRVDSIVARVAYTVALKRWVQLVPDLREVLLYFGINDSETETVDILRRWFLRNCLPDSDVSLQCRIYTPNGAISWSKRHNDLFYFPK